jgi:N6-L-threonylcarbamoyladenine synthase
VPNCLKEDGDFIEKNRNDLADSLQSTIISILMHQLKKAARKTGIKQIALAGGVSANSGLRDAVRRESGRQGWNVYIPPLRFTTDNAAMIAITGYYRYLAGEYAPEDISPLARMYF